MCFKRKKQTNIINQHEKDHLIIIYYTYIVFHRNGTTKD
jgi:hypothetical protein